MEAKEDSRHSAPCAKDGRPLTCAVTGRWPTFPALPITHHTVGAPSFTAFVKGENPHRSPHHI
jgi:hypothetical protein